jgi:hypothetical protein
MNELKFYLLALYAAKCDPNDVIPTPQPDGSIRWEIKPGTIIDRVPDASLWALGIVANSEAEARARGMEVLLERLPPKDGWVAHSVAANTLPREISNQIAEIVIGTPKESNDDEWPDIIM